MRYLDRLINFIFSLVILILSIVVIMVSTGFLPYAEVDGFITKTIFSEENNTITCIVAMLVFIASLKTTIFLSRAKNTRKSAIMVDTNHGRIQIAQETIENTAKSASRNYEEVKDANVRMIKAKKGIDIYMVLTVLQGTNIIELSAKVQDDVKKAVEGSTGVKVNNVDIKIRNIADAHKTKNRETVVKNEMVTEEIKESPMPQEEAVEAEKVEEIVEEEKPLEETQSEESRTEENE